MTATPDSELVQMAYGRISELARQDLKMGMIFDELRHEGFSDDVIVAATKERFAYTAHHFKKGAGRHFRVAVVFFVLGIIAWPITEMFDLGFIETGLVFCLFGVGVMAVGGAIWALITSRRHNLTHDQVDELVREGGVSVLSEKAPLTRENVISVPDENMEFAIRQTEALKRIETATFWCKLAVLVLGFVLMSANVSTSPWLTLGLGLPIFAFLITMLVPFLVNRIGAWVEFGSDRASANPGSGLTADSVLLTEVPRPENLPVASDDEVIRAEHLTTITPAPTSRGGKATELEDSETGVKQNRDLLPPGIVVFTSEGIVFYPNADSAGEMIKDTASTLLAAASSVSPFAQAAAELGLSSALKGKEPELALWQRESIKDENHFVIPWLELVIVLYSPLDQWVSLVRETADGTKTRYFFRSANNEWPEALMCTRLRHEAMSALREFVELPRMREILPDLVEKFRGVYGDRVNEHWPEIMREAEAQVAQQELGDAIEVLMKGMSKTLPHYGRYPKVRSVFPHFFPEKDEPTSDVAEEPAGAEESTAETKAAHDEKAPTENTAKKTPAKKTRAPKKKAPSKKDNPED